MGAVQKLATVVIIGLTGLGVLLVFLLADETNRRDAEAVEQADVAIERGVQTYIANCLACHGPAGEGSNEPGRVGRAIGGNTPERLINQTEDPILREQREREIRLRIHGGSPLGCSTTYPTVQCLMPPWGEDYGGELNNEQIEELVLMIQNVDWDHVYNEAIEANQGYPNPPVTPEATGTATVPPEPGTVRLEAYDLGWRTTDQPGPQVQLTVAPGGTIELVNAGAAAHDFSVDALGIDVDMPVGFTGSVTIPPETQPGTYDFICDVPGHSAVMFGTLTVDPNAAPAGGEPAPGAATPGASPEASPVATPGSGTAGQAIQLEAFDLGWRTADQPGPQVQLTVAPGTTIEVVNTGVGPHNFTLEALGLFVDLPPGGSGQVVIPPDTPPGEYQFICSVPGHSAIMFGTLTVQ